MFRKKIIKVVLVVFVIGMLVTIAFINSNDSNDEIPEEQQQPTIHGGGKPYTDSCGSDCHGG